LPSAEHRLLVQMIIRAMHSAGYRVVASDTHYFQLGNVRLKKPPALDRHQPDLVGIRSRAPRLSIGEAKTTNDLRTRHTREQLWDYAQVRDAVVIIAIPEGAATTYLKVATEIGLSNLPQIRVLKVPEALISHAEA